MAVGTSMMAAPAFVMVDVLKTGNLAAMGSVVMNFVTLACGFAWFCNGFFYMNSAPVYIQNGIGVTVGAAALAIRVYVATSEKHYALSRDEKYSKNAVASVFDTILGNSSLRGAAAATEMNKLTSDVERGEGVGVGESVNKNNNNLQTPVGEKDSDGAESGSGLITPDHGRR